METNPKKQRQHFYRDYASGQWSMSELCDRYQISRPTGYKWIDRIETEGLKAVDDRARAPNRHPNRTPEHVEREILVLREKYSWGATKLREILKRRHPNRRLPARSTLNEILDRHGHLRKNRRRRSWGHPGAVRLETAGPNEIWPADFKGQFRTGDGKYCFPLTVTDHYSRMLLLCKALHSVRTEGAKPALRALFRKYGLPDAIRTDNGAPFASTGIHGLCELNVWWMKLGIVHQRIRPSSPQENGQHERMHKDMKREATRPPAANLAKQQRQLDRFRQRYNHERPHEALDARRAMEAFHEGVLRSTPAARVSRSLRGPQSELLRNLSTPRSILPEQCARGGGHRTRGGGRCRVEHRLLQHRPWTNRPANR